MQRDAEAEAEAEADTQDEVSVAAHTLESMRRDDFWMTPHAKKNKKKKKKAEGPANCAICGTSSTPLWRRSVEHGILCNRCGIRNRNPHMNRR